MNPLANRVFLIAIMIAVIFACNRPSEGSRKAGEHITQTLVAVAETAPTPQKKNDDSADDPAIWINRENLEESVIIGTDKKGGLATYDLDGNLLNYYALGKMNNCDLRYDFVAGNDTFDILAASNRSRHSISLYKISSGGVLDSVHSRTIKSEVTDEVYGLCMYKSPKTGRYYVYLNSKAGEIEQWELFAKGKLVDAKLVRSFNVNTQTEGMMADDSCAVVYIGEEIAGIYKFDAEPDGATSGKFISLSSEENENIRYDIEGLTIYPTDSLNGYLIASSQGNYSFAVFERQGDNKYLGSFRIVEGKVDGVEETDGIDVTPVSLGQKYPKGMFVVQDGYNYEGEKLISQNFKMISWSAIEMYFIE